VSRSLVSAGAVERLIRLVRGRRVMLDADLARIYGVTTARLNQQVKRNRKRFPPDFLFQLTAEEWQALMLQSATSKEGRGGRRKLPFAFTEHGAVMLASVLNTPIAVRANVQVVRAFVRLRALLAGDRELRKQLAMLEQKVQGHDATIRRLFNVLRQLMSSPPPKTHRIGFLVKEAAARYRTAGRQRSVPGV